MKQILPFKNIVDIYCACPCLVFISCCFKANYSLFSMKPKLPLLNLIQGYYLSKKVLSLFYSFKPSFSNLNMRRNYSIENSSIILTQASASIVLMLLKREEFYLSNMGKHIRKYYYNNTHTACVGLLIVSFYSNPILKIYLSNTSEKNLRYPFKEFKNKKRQ